MTQTIEQLTAKVRELEKENASLRFALADTEALELGTSERLAATQAEIKRLEERRCEERGSEMKEYNEQVVETLDDAGCIIASKNIIIDNLQARIAELEREVAHWKNNHETEVRRARILKERTDMPIERVQAYEKWGVDQSRIAELEAENERLKREAADWRNEFSEDRDENNELRAQLAASQLRETQLRDALQTYIDEHEECQDADDWMAMMCSIEAHHVADEALAIPTNTSALDAYVEGKVKEAWPIVSSYPDQNTELRMQLTELNRQRDLAVEALQFFMDHGICEATYYKVREALSTINGEVKE